MPFSKTKKISQWITLVERPIELEDNTSYQLVTVRRGFAGVESRGIFRGKEIKVKNYFVVHAGDFLISKRQIAHGACGIVPESLDGAVVSNEYNVFVPQKETNIDFFFLIMQLPYYKRLFYLMSDGVHIEKLLFKTNDWMKRSLSLPPLPEQQKIAAILSTQDKVIELKEKLLAQKVQQKKYLMQQLLTGKLRLPGVNGEWMTVKLKELLSERNEKNVEQNHRICSVAVSKGVVDQIEHLGRSYAAADTSNYGVAHYGDIIYTKSPTGDFSLGIIKQNRMRENVAVSPLYGIYKPISFSTGYLLNVHFESAINTKNYLTPIVQKGAKNTIAISNSVFLENKILFPMDEATRSKIAKIFELTDHEIDMLQKSIEAEKQKKKALMQLLLTGKVSVRI